MGVMGDLPLPGNVGTMPSHPTGALIGLYKLVPALWLGC